MRRRNMVSLLTIVLIVVLVAPQLSAQKTDVKVNGRDIWNLINYMAADEFLGRRPNTPEMFECQEWAKGLFEEWGLEPGGENGTFFQAVPIRSHTFTRGTPKMVINGREFFVKFNDFSIDTRSTTGKNVKGNLVFVGYGISAPDKGLDEYSNVDVKGKIVFILKGNPNDVEAPRGRFDPDESTTEIVDAWEAESQDTTKIKIAYEKGAAGIIFYNANPSELDNRMRGRGRGSDAQLSFTRDLIIATANDEEIYQWVFWTDPQESSGGFERRMNKMQLDIKGGTPCSFETSMKAEMSGFDQVDIYGEQYGNHECRNVIGKITGTDPVLKNECIVLGGHFDHLAILTRLRRKRQPVRVYYYPI